MRRRTLYLPIEIKYRELLGKTLLAAKAVDRGWRVYMGGVDLHDHMATGFAPGLLIENNIPDTKATRLGQLKTKGYRIADLCEESIIYPDAQDYVARKIGLRSLPATSVILATGARSQRDICALRKDAARKLVVTGNPRFDTLMPSVRVVYEDEARKIRDRYGRFLFVTTNFSSANPFKTGLDVVAVLQRDGKLATPEQADLKRRQVAYKARHMKGMQTLLIEVARWRGLAHSILSFSDRTRQRIMRRGRLGPPTRASRSNTRGAPMSGCWPPTWFSIPAARLVSRRCCWTAGSPAMYPNPKASS